MRPAAELPGPKEKKGPSCHGLTDVPGPDPQFPHLHNGELDSEAPVPMSRFNQRQSDQQALSGDPGPQGPGRELSTAPGRRPSRGTQAQAVVAPWPGGRARPPGSGGHASSSRQVPGPAPARGTPRGDPARPSLRRPSRRTVPGAPPQRDTHPPGARWRGPGAAGRRPPATAAAAAAAPGPPRDGRGPRPPWKARRLRAEAAERGLLARRRGEVCAGALPAAL